MSTASLLTNRRSGLGPEFALLIFIGVLAAPEMAGLSGVLLSNTQVQQANARQPHDTEAGLNGKAAAEDVPVHISLYIQMSKQYIGSTAVDLHL